jgi:hypothetical protein
MWHKIMDILTHLTEVYKNLYVHKDIFKVNFKYSPDDIEDFYKKIQNLIEEKIVKKSVLKKTIRADIIALKTADDVKGYLYQANDTINDTLIKEFSFDEYACLYEIVYKSPLKSKKKKDALNAIKKYFHGIERAVSLKP